MSCVDAIVAVTEINRTQIDERAQGQACFVDLQKAIDPFNCDLSNF